MQLCKASRRPVSEAAPFFQKLTYKARALLGQSLPQEPFDSPKKPSDFQTFGRNLLIYGEAAP